MGSYVRGAGGGCDYRGGGVRTLKFIFRGALFLVARVGLRCIFALLTNTHTMKITIHYKGIPLDVKGDYYAGYNPRSRDEQDEPSQFEIEHIYVEGDNHNIYDLVADQIDEITAECIKEIETV